MDCVFGPIWLHSVDWAQRVSNTATGILQGVTCGVADNFGVNVCRMINELGWDLYVQTHNPCVRKVKMF